MNIALYNIILTVHVIVSLSLIIVVLMQSSKGGGLAGAFGGGGDTVFGGHETATFLNKATTYLAFAFMLLSLTLALMASKRSARTPQSDVQRALQQGGIIPAGESVESILNTTVFDSIPADSQ